MTSARLRLSTAAAASRAAASSFGTQAVIWIIEAFSVVVSEVKQGYWH